ncbi:MAG: glycosyltransferase [Actinomycetota bacterium]
MLPHVPVPPKHLDAYREAAGDEAVERFLEVARPLKGIRLLHLNSTSFGGGVAELLFTHIGLLQDVGIDAQWHLIEGSDDFFAITKAAHNGLQGAEVPWTRDMEKTYMERVRANAANLDSEWDVYFIHDPQPAALRTILEQEGRLHGTWIWRCHIDLSRTFRPVWDYFATHVEQYDAAIFTMADFVQSGFAGPRVETIAPSIDPLSPKNAPLDEGTVWDVVRSYDVDADRPIVSQVSRFDPWKDPVGVIQAYRMAKEEIRGLQLVMIASMASDDPEGWHYLHVTEDAADGDPDVHLLTNLQEVGSLQVNAFQRASRVVIQKSLREGFGLVVSEAMWKEKPVIGGAVGGITLQIEDGVSGYLVDSVEGCAKRLVELLHDPDLGAQLGRTARDRVRDRFLTLRELEDYLRLIASLQ